MKFLKQLNNLIKPFLPRIRVLLAFLLLFEIIRLANPYLFKLVIDKLIEFKPEDLSEILMFLALIFVAENFLVLVDNLTDKYIFRLINNLEKYLLQLAHNKLLELSLDYHERENTGDKISKIERGTDRLLEFIANSLWDFIPTIFQGIITFVAIFWLNWVLAVVYVIFIPPYVWLSFKMSKKQRPFRKKVNKYYEKSSGHLSENIINIQTVQGYGSENYERRKYNGILGILFKKHWQSFLTFLKYNWQRSLLLNIGRVTLFTFGVFWTAQGNITPGGLVMFITLSEKVYMNLFRLFRIFDRLMDSKETAQRLTKLLEAKPQVKSYKNAQPKAVRGQIEFRNVNFCYASGYCAIKNLNFQIRAGEKVAIVGPSGGGKTTIAKLLYRHYDVTKGEILIDNINIKRYDLENFRRQLGIVMQDVGVFNRTIRENISYGLSTPVEANIINSAKIAQAHGFILSLPNGYNTLVGERGVKLSGGQRQRLGIARAIIRQPKILIFDEATSSLDAESESKIQQAIKLIGQGRTMIVIAHRLSTIRYMDRILVIEKGRLIEEGSHDDLTRQKGLYYRLSKLQTNYQLRK